MMNKLSIPTQDTTVRWNPYNIKEIVLCSKKDMIFNTNLIHLLFKCLKLIF